MAGNGSKCTQDTSDNDELHIINLKTLNHIMSNEAHGVATRWYKLGVELLDSKTAVLDMIKTSHQRDDDRCSEMFKTWLEMRPDANWSQLVTALNNIELKTAARNIEISKLSGKGSVIKPLTNLTIKDNITADEASAEFGLILVEILEELKQNESANINKLHIISSALTVKDKSGVRMFSDSELEDIQSCKCIKTLLFNKLRHCYRWDDYSILTVLMKSLKAKKSLKLLQLFAIKTYSLIKLHQIQAQLPQESCKTSEGYRKMIVIVDKIFSEITKEEYDELKQFIADHCGVEPYVVSPFLKAHPDFSVAIEWCIPVDAISYMIEIAKANSQKFCKERFLYLKISSTVIFDYRDNFCLCTVSCCGECQYAPCDCIDRMKENASEYDELIKAILSWDIATVERIINTRYIDVNSTDKDGSTPLHTAASTNNHQMVAILIKLGAKINPTKSGWTPLHAAVHKNRARVAEMLIKFGANINAVTKDGWTSLHDAASEGHIQSVEVLLKSEKIDIDAAIYNGWTPLHAASNWNRIEVVKLLIKSGANVNITQNEDGWTPLHCAARYGNIEIAEMLITAGSNINAVSKGGDLPMHLAASNGQIKIVKLLVKAGAEISIANKQKKLPIEVAFDCNKYHVVQYFVEKAKMSLNVLDYVTRCKIKMQIERRGCGYLADGYDSDHYSDVSSASSGHESSDTEEE